MGRPSRKDELLAAGIDVLHRQGYAGSSVDAIVEQAGMQKGSFFGHFGSKEAFANEAIKGYFKHWTDSAKALMANTTLSAWDKFKGLNDLSTGSGGDHTLQYGCLIGNLAAELSSRSEEVRTTLTALFEQWAAPYAQMVREGIASGDFHPGLDPEGTARFIVNALQGTVLRAKVEHSAQPLEDYVTLVSTLLRVEGKSASSA
ncbi:MAG: Transcriptional regulator AcuR [Pseudomonas fluorescens]|nr:MAG: Transcriptional regulator AcuR [Pseudomonas fluorescens]